MASFEGPEPRTSAVLFWVRPCSFSKSACDLELWPRTSVLELATQSTKVDDFASAVKHSSELSAAWENFPQSSPRRKLPPVDAKKESREASSKVLAKSMTQA